MKNYSVRLQPGNLRDYTLLFYFVRPEIYSTALHIQFFL